jgi:hypothetical protein
MTFIPLTISPSGSTFADLTNRANDFGSLLNNLGAYDSINIISGAISNVNITLSHIDSTTIGENTAAAAIFTDLSAIGHIDFSAASAIVLGSGQISGNAITGGAITNVLVTLSADPTSIMDATTKQYVDAFMLPTRTFDRIAVATQSTVSSASPTDELTFIAGAGMTLTTDPVGQTITFSSAGALGTLASLSSVDLTTNVSNVLPIENGGTGASTISAARTNLQLGTAATFNVGTSANMVVQLNGSSQLPAISGALLTNLPTAGYALLSSSQSFSGGQRTTSIAISSSGGVTNLDFNLSNDFTTTITENTQIANPSNIVAGQKGRIAITQSSGGSISYGSSWKFKSGADRSVSSGGGSLDVLYYDVVDGSHIVASLVKGFA